VTNDAKPPKEDSGPLQHWVQIVQAEYRESPGLRLTSSQVQRFWGLDQSTCRAILSELESSRFLRRTSGDRYARSDVW
jgi:Fic family protein